VVYDSSVESEDEVVEVVLLLVELEAEAVEAAAKILVFGIISSRLVPFVSGTKASENRKPMAEIMAYVQNVP